MARTARDLVAAARLASTPAAQSAARVEAPMQAIAPARIEDVAADGSVGLCIPLLQLTGVRTQVSLVPREQLLPGRAVAVSFQEGDRHRPVVLGLLLQPGDVHARAPDVDAVLDGEHVKLSASQQIELRCGEAAIVLHADGRIQLRGVYITSHATATQRILGGSVNVN